MTHPIVMHVNYCEQGQTIEEMCQKAAAWGYDGIEFRRLRRGADESPQDYLDTIASAATTAGLSTVLFGGPGFELMTDDSAARRAQIDEGLAFYRMAAQRFQLTVCNCMAGGLRNADASVPYGDYAGHGSTVARAEHYAWAVEGFVELGALAEELGFKLAFETHMGYLHDLPAPTRALLDQIGSPAVGTNLDYGNIVHFPTAPSLEDSVAALAGTIHMVHLKNSLSVGEARLATGLADGSINNREFLRLLRRYGFTGPICIEAPRAGDREWFAQQDIIYLRSLLADLDAWSAPE
jgi:sugar phosphate isomerase/epimerase